MVPTLPNLRIWPPVLMAVLVAPINFGMWLLGDTQRVFRPVFYLLCGVQLVLALLRTLTAASWPALAKLVAASRPAPRTMDVKRCMAYSSSNLPQVVL
jgi:hypothetical protein